MEDGVKKVLAGNPTLSKKVDLSMPDGGTTPSAIPVDMSSKSGQAEANTVSKEAITPSRNDKRTTTATSASTTVDQSALKVAPVGSTKVTTIPDPKNATVNETKGQQNDGNDRVTVDQPPKQSLTAGTLVKPASATTPASEKPLTTTSTTTVISKAVVSTLATAAKAVPSVQSAISGVPSSATAKQISTAVPLRKAVTQPNTKATAAVQPPSSVSSVATNAPSIVLHKPVVSAKPLSIAALPAKPPPTTVNMPVVPPAAPLHDTRNPSTLYQQSTLQAANEAAIAEARSPLTNVYGQFLCSSTDACLEDARNRLKKALSQTLALRQQFTERVYTKYRVNLTIPPKLEDVLAKLKADPVGEYKRINEEITSIREEKEAEKKEASQLNNEMTLTAVADRAAILSNIDNAEQLMFLTAGLNLVVLPENQADPLPYPEQTRSISVAAATSGEVMLDRTRKAAAMRVERQRRRQLKLLRGEVAADGEAESNYSRLQILSSATAPTAARLAGPSASTAATTTTPTGKKNATGASKATASTTRKASSTSTKQRSRAQSSLSTNVLLNLAASADEIKTTGTKLRPSTLALMARGVGPTSTKTTQQRLLHPHPESLGGRRRASANPSASRNAAMNPPEPFLQAYLANTLPPLPAIKERLERKPLPVIAAAAGIPERTRKSIQDVLNSFYDTDRKSLQSVSKIELLNSVRKLNSSSKEASNIGAEKETENQDGEAATAAKSAYSISNAAVDPALTVSVLHALGLIGRSKKQPGGGGFTMPSFSEENTALCSKKFKQLRSSIAFDEKALMESIFDVSGNRVDSEASRKRPLQVAPDGDVAKPVKKAKVGDKTSIPLEIIRGGGDAFIGEKEEGKKEGNVVESTEQIKMDREDDSPSTPAGARAVVPKKRKRSDSSPTFSAAIMAGINMQSGLMTSTAPGSSAQIQYMGPQIGHNGPAESNQFHANINTMHIANQLHQMHHPSAGDLAQYLGSLQQHPQGYDLSALMPGTTHSQLPGFVPTNANLSGFAIQDRAASAQAMVLREQQAALLGGYPPIAGAGFSHNYFGAQTSSYFPGAPQQKPAKSAGTKANNEHESKEKSVAGSEQKSKATLTNKKRSKGSIVDTVKKPKITDPNTSAELLPQGKIASAAPLKQSELKPNFLGHDSMKFSPPPCPTSLSKECGELIGAGLFHDAVGKLSPSNHAEAVSFLVASGAAVPIPKGLVLGPLKERLNTPGFRSAGNNAAPPITRDVVAAAVLVWLWSTNEAIFQKAFEKNGRIDVDPDCKWLVQAAVDTAVGELSLEIAESMARGEGAFAIASAARKSTATATGKPVSAPSTTPANLDVCTASIVAKALTIQMIIDPEMSTVIPQYPQLVELLDETRLAALRAKSQERVFLATLISRNTTMTENFGHSYATAMVRAGEALGHGALFEAAQDEDVMASTMIPYDIFTDDHEWEDPCKPDVGFTFGLSGDEMVRRAHARAVIQKSLRKLQDRHHIRGGTQTYGPYFDHSGNEHTHGGGVHHTASSPRPGQKRRHSALSEHPVQPGTGSGNATSWTVYDPKHFSSALVWDPDNRGNSPYGRHSIPDRSRSLSLIASRNVAHGDSKVKRSPSLSLSLKDPSVADSTSTVSRGTREIDWVDVASVFQSVELPRKSSRSKVQEQDKDPIPVSGPIFAPHCRELEGDLSANDDESDTEEDFSEKTTLEKHQVVLDLMKAHLDEFLEARKKQQERRKNRYNK